MKIFKILALTLLSAPYFCYLTAGPGWTLSKHLYNQQIGTTSAKKTFAPINALKTHSAAPCVSSITTLKQQAHSSLRESKWLFGYDTKNYVQQAAPYKRGISHQSFVPNNLNNLGTFCSRYKKRRKLQKDINKILEKRQSEHLQQKRLLENTTLKPEEAELKTDKKNIKKRCTATEKESELK